MRPTLKHASCLVAVLILVIAAQAGAADVSIKPGDQVVRITVQTPEQLQRLLDMDLDVWSDYPGIGLVPVHVSPAERAALEAAGFSYTVLNPDLMATYRREQAELAHPSRQPYDSYPTLDEITARINGLAAAHPELCDVFSIGTSIEGRPIWVLHITGSSAPHKPAVFYHGLQHCREWIGGPVVLYLADYLVNNYGTNSDVTALVNGLDIYLAPCVNPDGYSYTWTTYRLWRKNRRHNSDGTYGIDLNRNWGYGWGGNGSSGTTSNETYRGPAPFSEPETTALSNFVASHFGIIAYMDYHSFSELILWPYGYANVLPSEPDYTTFNTLGLTIQSLIEAVHGVHYTQGPIYSTIYQASGGSADWVYGAQQRYGMSIELRPSDSDPNGFLLPADQILPTCEENLPGILHLTQFAAQRSRVSISLPNGPPTMLAPGTQTPISVLIPYFGEQLVTGSPTLHYRYDGGTWHTASLTPISGDQYQAVLPPANCSSTPEFYFTAQGSVSGTVSLPTGAPTSAFTAAVGAWTTTFADNFETNTGWTVQTTATRGAWVRGVPVNCGRGDPPTDYDGSSSCYLTGNSTSNCNNDVNGGYTYLISPTIDLSGGTAVVSYALWYLNSYGSDPDNDLFKVYVSNDNGGAWTSVSTFGPWTAYGWTLHSFNVADYVTPTALVRVRFEASDLGNASIVEGGVDAFAVRRRQCVDVPVCTTVLGDMNGDGLVNGADIQGFVTAMVSTYDPCADMNASGGPIDMTDLNAFVSALTGAP